MKHFATPEFWKHYRRLPVEARKLADKNFALLKTSSSHPSLHLKKIGRFWSVSIGRRYRSLAVETSEGLLWFWIGTHADYDDLLRQKS